jgi:hypothetical protein
MHILLMTIWIPYRQANDDDDDDDDDENKVVRPCERGDAVKWDEGGWRAYSCTRVGGRRDADEIGHLAVAHQVIDLLTRLVDHLGRGVALDAHAQRGQTLEAVVHQVLVALQANVELVAVGEDLDDLPNIGRLRAQQLEQVLRPVDVLAQVLALRTLCTHTHTHTQDHQRRESQQTRPPKHTQHNTYPGRAGT